MKRVYPYFIAFILSLVTFGGFPAVLNVPATYSTIQSGIDASADGDTVLVDPGTYYENLNLGGKNIVLCSWFLTTGNSSHIENTIIDGNYSGRVITVNLGETSSCKIAGFTIQNGNSSYESDEQYGGGIFISYSSPQIMHCIVQNSYAPVCAGGVAVWGSSSDPKIENCTIRNNSSDGYGGGVFMGDCGPGAEFVNCTISGNFNFINNNWNGGGGGANLYHTGKLTNCLITGNSVPYGYTGGGGIQCDWGTYWGSQAIFVTGCTIAGNTALDFGGVTYVHGLPDGEFRNCIIWGNTDLYSNISNWDGNSYANCCSDPLPSGIGNISFDPLFIDPLSGNYRLGSGSPCINAGDNAFNNQLTDLDGNLRTFNGTIDMGAYEFNDVGTTVQVGSGSDQSWDFPVYTCGNFNYSQQIYLGSEITAEGGFTGFITKLRFYYYGGSSSPSQWNNWTVYLGNTAKSDFTDYTDWVPISSLSQVFIGTIPDPVDGSWVEIVFQTPFFYSGGNLVVAVDENSNGNDCTAWWAAFYSNANRGLIYSGNSNPDPAAPLTANFSEYWIPQIQLYMNDAYGVLDGTITELPGCTNPMEGATVTAGVFSAVTGPSGQYHLDLPAGVYNITAEYHGDTQTVSNLEVNTGSTLIQDFCLTPWFAPPVDLKATVTGPVLNDVHLTWLDPGSTADQWIHWDNGISGGGLGYGNYPITFSIASRWPVADIAPYAGTYLKKIRFVIGEPTATYTIKIWKGPNASTLLYSQPVTDPDISMWTEVTLASPVLIDGSDEIWFGLEISQTQGYPAGFDQGPAVAGKGDMINAPGWGWISVKNSWNYNFNWSLQGFVSENPLVTGPVAVNPMIQGAAETPAQQFPGEEAAVKPLVRFFENNGPQADLSEVSAMPVSLQPSGTAGSPSSPSSGILTGYNVYRNSVQIASNIPDLFYDDLSLAAGIYDYEVSAQYDNGESLPIGPAQVEIFSCFPPENILVPNVNLGTTTALVSWNPSSITPVADWDVEYGFSGFTPGFGSGTTIHVTGTPQVILAGLYPGSQYDVYIRTNCSSLDHSLWALKKFRTHYFACPVSSGPEAEACGNNTNYGCAQNPYAFEPITCGDTICGTGWLQNSHRDEDWYSFTLTETKEVNIGFTSEFTIKAILYNGTCPVNGWLYNVGIYKGYHHAIQLQLNAGTYYLMMAPEWGEEVVCDSLNKYWLSLNCSTCLRPSGLTATNITNSSADLQWTSDASSWNIEWGPGGFAQGNGTVINTNSNPFTLSGLSEGNAYSYYVQSICNGNEYTPWAGPYNFFIPCSGSLSLPYYEDFSAQPAYITPICWQVTGSGTSQNWITYPTNYAGGTAPELYFQTYPWINGGQTYLLSPVINTTGETELTLSFNLMHFPNNSSPVFEIYSTSDGGTNWNHIWSFSPYGNSGLQTITVNTTDVGSAGFQFAFYLSGNSWDMGTLAIDDISLTGGGGGGKLLSVRVFLEGLYDGMWGQNQAFDEFGPHFGTGIADQVTLELHNEFSYPTLEYSTGPVDLNTFGMVNAFVPLSLTGNYYLTVRHRNSIETTSSYAIDFSGSSVSYDFTISNTQAFADNLKNNGDGSFSVWGGDVNQDGIVDAGDMNPVDNLATTITFGYVPEDVNGDGIVDGGDMNIVDNNSTAIIMVLLP